MLAEGEASLAGFAGCFASYLVVGCGDAREEPAGVERVGVRRVAVDDRGDCGEQGQPAFDFDPLSFTRFA